MWLCHWCEGPLATKARTGGFFGGEYCFMEGRGFHAEKCLPEAKLHIISKLRAGLADLDAGDMDFYAWGHAVRLVQALDA